MADELRDKVVTFQTAMALVKEMVKNGIISEADAALVEPEIARKFGIKNISIFR